MKFPTEWNNKKCSKPPTSYLWMENPPFVHHFLNGKTWFFHIFFDVSPRPNPQRPGWAAKPTIRSGSPHHPEDDRTEFVSWDDDIGNGMAGWWYTYPSEKYESVGMIIPKWMDNCMGWWHSQLNGKIKTGWWCNSHLEKHEFVNGKDYPIYYGQ